MTHLYPLPILCLFLCTCAPSPETTGPPPLPFDYEYALLPGALDSSKMEAHLGKLRLELRSDSALLYSPFKDDRFNLPAYAAADTSGGITDTAYFVYTVGEDGSLEAEVALGAVTSRERFRPVVRNAVRPWTADMEGRAYRMRTDTADFLVYLYERFPRPDGSFMEGYLLQLNADGSRHITRRFQGFGFGRHGEVYVTFRPPGRQPYQPTPYPGTSTVLVTARDAADRPLLALVDPGQPETVWVDTFRLEPYPSPLPPGTTAADLLPLLTLSRLEMGTVPPEPDSVGIEYLDPEPNRPDPVLRYAELADLDIAFDENGTFTYFAGDRMVAGGGWELSRDGNFLIMNPSGYHRGGPMLIEGYSEGELRVPVPLNVQTRKPRGVRIRSYFRPEVSIRFIRE